MGKIFVEHCNGPTYYECKSCKTSFASKLDLISTEFSSVHGRAYLFKRVVNIIYGEREVKNLGTAVHLIRFAKCKVCKIALGWKYENKHSPEFYYCENGLTVLDWSVIKMCNGFEENYAFRINQVQ